MAIVRNGIFNLKENGAVEALETLLELAKDDQLEGFTFAGFMPDRTTIMCTNNLELLDHQHLVCVLQNDVNYRSFDERMVYSVISAEEMIRRDLYEEDFGDGE